MSVLILRGRFKELPVRNDYTTYHIEEYMRGHGMGSHGLEVISGEGGSSSWYGRGHGTFTMVDYAELYDDWIYGDT